MLVLLFALATVLAWMLINLIYLVAIVAVARRFGISISEVSLGLGPTIWTLWRAEVWRLKLLPLGGYVRFLVQDPATLCPSLSASEGLPLRWRSGSDKTALAQALGSEPDDEAPGELQDDALDDEEVLGEESERAEDAPFYVAGSFETASVLQRIATCAAGPVAALLVGLLLLGVPVWRGAEQMVAAHGEVAVLRPTAVAGLVYVDAPSTWQGQMQLVWDTVGYYFTRLYTFQSLKGWGGWVALFTTGGRLGASSLEDWSLCLGILAFALGAVNLLPLPLLNGFQIVQVLLAACWGRARLPDRILSPLMFFGLLYGLAGSLYSVWLDVNWIKETWLG